VTNLANEECAIIRKEVSLNLKDFCSLFEIDLLCSYIQTLQKDSNDSVRIYLMEAIVSLKDNPELARVYEFISCTILALSKDESWRVRLTVADKIHEILALPNAPDYLKISVIEIFASLIVDPESETRNTCCTRLETMADLIGASEGMDKILIQLKKIEKDNTVYVRSTLAHSLLRLAPLVGKARTSEYIFPIFLKMINDEIHDIRMILIKNLDRLHEVVNVDMYVQSIIPSLFEIASNKSWRTRVQITESITVIARILVIYCLKYFIRIKICLWRIFFLSVWAG
jgi:serine/threonine-protein phosphatase 2A regulatory subunit A